MIANTTVPTFYQLLAVEPSASADQIRKAFRAEIARYHPDKVHHLGKEFQEMAATRAAQLTEAYRTLMNPELRSDYDRQHVSGAAGVASSRASTAEPQSPVAAPVAVAPPPGAGPRDTRFAHEHATRDEFVRKAILGRVRQVLAAEHGEVDELPARGFHFHCRTKSKKIFGGGGLQRIAVRFVQVVDAAAVQETWALAQKAGGSICVLLMGSGMAAARELSTAITELRRRSRGGSTVSIIPVDLRDWSAHVPEDAPRSCKNLLLRLRESSQ